MKYIIAVSVNLIAWESVKMGDWYAAVVLGIISGIAAVKIEELIRRS